MSSGLKISKPGVSVRTAQLNEILYDSTVKSPKIFNIIEFDVAGEYAHGLGYTPKYIAFRENADGTLWGIQRGYQDGGRAYIQVDNEKVYSLEQPFGTEEKTVVFLFIDPFNDADV